MLEKDFEQMIFNRDILCHHGIKGMKWGVRRTPEQLGYKAKKNYTELIISLLKNINLCPKIKI